MQKIKTACLYIVLGLCIMLVGRLMKSNYLTSFLLNNLLTVIITVLAINVASISNVLSRLHNINDQIEKATGQKKDFFSKTKRELKNSCNEQLFMIAAAILCSMFYSSGGFEGSPIIKDIAEVGLSSVLVWDIFVLKDVISSVFVLSDFEINSTRK